MNLSYIIKFAHISTFKGLSLCTQGNNIISCGLPMNDHGIICCYSTQLGRVELEAHGDRQCKSCDQHQSQSLHTLIGVQRTLNWI